MADTARAMIDTAPTGPTLDRATYLGGSDAPGLYNLGFRSELDVWGEKRGLAVVTPTIRMRLGSATERGALSVYAEDRGLTLTFPGTMRHPTIPMIGATPDAIADGCIDVQAKLVGPGQAHRWGLEQDGPDGIPEDVYIQVQWEMVVARALLRVPIEVAHVVANLCGVDLRCYEVPRDEATGDALLEHGVAWWKRYVEGGEMPLGDGGAARELLAAVYPRVVKPLRPATAAEVILAAQYAALRATEREAKERKDAVGARLCALIGDAEGFTLGETSVTWREARGKVRWKEAAERAGATSVPGLIDECRGEPGRVLRVRVGAEGDEDHG